MINVEVMFFGPAQTLTGAERTTVEVPEGARLQAVLDIIGDRFPRLGEALRRGGGIRFAVNAGFADPDQLLSSGDEVAVIPPVSGGSTGQDHAPVGRDLVAMVETPIDFPAALDRLSGDPRQGGVSVFVGTTRAETHPQHGPLRHLEYEAYQEMAEGHMRALLEQCRRRWPIGPAVMVHRVGRVTLGEASVLIGVAGPHRQDAFAASRWLIDTLKKEVPIWKREVWADGRAIWVDPTKTSR